MPHLADLRVLGLDVGGSHSRALLADAAGARLGVGAAGGGNPATHGARTAADRIREALLAALGDTAPADVAGCVIGIAGAGRFASEPDAVVAIEGMAAEVGLACGVRLVSDVTVAFAAGTTRADGALLLSGTGAVAARLRDREPVEIRDGYGWLLGDAGSGFWIGREAVRATLAAIDGRAAMTELPGLVLRHFGAGFDGAGFDGAEIDGAGVNGAEIDGAGVNGAETDGAAVDGTGSIDGRQNSAGIAVVGVPTVGKAGHRVAGTVGEEPAAGLGTPVSVAAGHRLGDAFSRDDRKLATELVRTVGASPTVAMAELAPVVMAAFELGDPAAGRIVADAAGRLVDSLAGLALDDPDADAIVLAGSVLTSGSPVRDLVAKAIAERWPRAEIGIAADGAAGAAWLALRGLAGVDAAALAAAHARLIAR